MRYFILFCLLIISQPAKATDECDFDQANRIKENLILKTKYPGSNLIDGNLVLEIPQKGGLVRINIGGCVHYGINIELETNNLSQYPTEADFMSGILSLSSTFSQGKIDIKKLEKLILKKNWNQPDPKERYYFFNYESFSTFEVYEQRDKNKLVIGINYYN